MSSTLSIMRDFYFDILVRERGFRRGVLALGHGMGVIGLGMVFLLALPLLIWDVSGGIYIGRASASRSMERKGNRWVIAALVWLLVLFAVATPILTTTASAATTASVGGGGGGGGASEEMYYPQVCIPCPHPKKSMEGESKREICCKGSKCCP